MVSIDLDTFDYNAIIPALSDKDRRVIDEILTVMGEESDDQGFHRMMVGIAVERAIHDTGRCVCGRRPTVRDRIRQVLFRLCLGGVR